ncbi:hypothetical protein B0J18DRAFT_288044 [Chaetomium sp. MPI-SDFR-AT-0129]|nr:hypothetical protein B0J18DRAFT_288044 [Chaetomium sp. MPI-SDFR-AT-0129]
MGISGLLPLLKSIHRPVELKKYAGETLGIDGYAWLHRGSVACAIELAEGKPTRKYVDFAMHRVRMFKYFGVMPYLVFDGDFLPSKAKTESSRLKRREESKKIGLELLRAGKPSQAYSELQKAIDVTPEMARHLIEELKKADIPYVVAPYEADAQLVYLERHGFINGIVTEDSDLLVFGAKRLLTKMDQHGQCIEINRRDFCSVREVSLTGWTDREFRHMAILSGCDYLDGINNVGLKTAYRLIRKHKTPERIVKMLRFGGKHHIADTYLDDFKQAELTFLHQRVFCPKKRDIVLLTDPEPSVNVDDMLFIGAPVDTETARAIAVGDVNPITKARIVMPRSPGKRTISQALASVSGPARNLGKPITEFFQNKKSRRIPLGEMDPNCFAVDHNQNTSAAVEEEPRAIVFPLPRPYVEGAEEIAAGPVRPYTSNTRLRRKTEPLSKLLGFEVLESSEHRRRTAGPAIEIYQDTVASPRPPKKVRLCEDSAADVDGVVTATPEKSKFFPSTRQKKPAKKQRDNDILLLSDDSIEEAFRSLPDPSWRSEKSAKSGSGLNVFQDLSPVKPKEDIQSPTKSEQVDNDDTVEVPASSPIQSGSAANQHSDNNPMSATPLGELLKGFSYDSARPRAKVVHGLPTPASSIQETATPRSSSQTATRGPMMTPLQRMGAQALRRGKPLPNYSTPPTPMSSGSPRPSASLPVDPAFIPLPKVDVEEVEALNRSMGSEDQIIPDSDGEDDAEHDRSMVPGVIKPLNLSRFLYA